MNSSDNSFFKNMKFYLKNKYFRGIVISSGIMVIFLVLILICINTRERITRPMYSTTKDGWNYTKLQDAKTGEEYIVIHTYSGNEHDTIAIPERIEGLPVKILQGQVFKFSYELKKLIIPKTVEEIKEGGIQFTDIEEVEFEEGSCLKVCNGLGSSSITSIHLPDSVEVIYEKAFSGGVKLEEIYIGPNVKEIGENAFDDTKIKNIVLSKDNKYLEWKDGLLVSKEESRLLTYDHDLYLDEITIPAYIKSIDDTALDGIELERINVDEENEVYFSENDCLYTIDERYGKTLCKVPEGMDISKFEFGKDVETIGCYSMANCFSDETVVFPDSVKNIELWAIGSFDIHVSNTLRHIAIPFYTRTIYFHGTEADWEKVDVENTVSFDELPYEVVYVED